MDNERNDSEKMDEVMMPGFRFHPTDEELVGFYLRRKIQHRPPSIELIKQLDIYKFDPWDLPKLATTGEKEWYFYCPRDRKYRNSARPNRVTGAGFWKATGTDRPIYSSEGSKCIGLKKSLVFYKGRAAKGIKTDWMMHEFRLPSIPDTGPSKRYMDKDNIPPNDAWAICRIFKKANSTTQRALSHSCVSTMLPKTTTTSTTSDILTQNIYGTTSNFSSNTSMHSTTKPTSSVIQFDDSTKYVQQSSIGSFSKCDLPITSTFPTISIPTSEPSKCNIDASSMLLNMPPSVFEDFDELLQDHYFHHNYFTITLPDDQELRRNLTQYDDQEETATTLVNVDDNVAQRDQEYWGTIMQSVEYPSFNMALMNMGEYAWKSNLLRDSTPCPGSDIPIGFSTNKCYT